MEISRFGAASLLMCIGSVSQVCVWRGAFRRASTPHDHQVSRLKMVCDVCFAKQVARPGFWR